VLVVVEALLLALGAGAAGLALADVAIPAAAHFSILRLPEIHLSNSDLLAGIGIAVLLGLAAAAIPAWLSRRLTVIEALARQ
jgi:ABC-type antimicrobial peptide transport system permease subunit